MNFEDIVLFENSIDYAMYLETNNVDWCMLDDEVKWWDGDIYSVEFREGFHEDNDFVMVNGDNGCGETITYILPLSKKMSAEDFDDKYE